MTAEPAAAGAGAGGNPMEKLKQFKAMLVSDLISKADYDRQKEIIIAEMGGTHCPPRVRSWLRAWRVR